MPFVPHRKVEAFWWDVAEGPRCFGSMSATPDPVFQEEVQSELFKEFYQLDVPSGPRSDSLGLGLSIVDGLAQLLGHKIELASNLGRGTRFSVSVPRAPAPGSRFTGNPACHHD